MRFDIQSQIVGIETIAKGKGIRAVNRLRKLYGKGHWRKLKGVATIRLPSGDLCDAEIHWYEAEGIGRKEFKIKQLL